MRARAPKGFDATREAERVIQARGYIVVGSVKRYQIGDVMLNLGEGRERLARPLVVTAKTDASDMLAQFRLMGLQDPEEEKMQLALLLRMEPHVRFWRVVFL